jgi:hypothetical protein
MTWGRLNQEIAKHTLHEVERLNPGNANREIGVPGRHQCFLNKFFSVFTSSCTVGGG